MNRGESPGELAGPTVCGQRGDKYQEEGGQLDIRVLQTQNLRHLEQTTRPRSRCESQSGEPRPVCHDVHSLGPCSTPKLEAGPLESRGAAEEPPILTPWDPSCSTPLSEA